MSVDIDELSFAELKKLQDHVATRIQEKEVEERESVRLELEELARSRGFDLASLISGNKEKKSTKKVAPKYRNPNNADETWTGRGRKPKWIVSALDAGSQLEDFAI